MKTGHLTFGDDGVDPSTRIYTDEKLEEMRNTFFMKSQDDIDIHQGDQDELTRTLDQHGIRALHQWQADIKLGLIQFLALVAQIPLPVLQRSVHEAHLVASRPEATPLDKVDAAQFWELLKFMQELHRISLREIGSKTYGEMTKQGDKPEIKFEV